MTNQTNGSSNAMLVLISTGVDPTWAAQIVRQECAGTNTYVFVPDSAAASFADLKKGGAHLESYPGTGMHWRAGSKDRDLGFERCLLFLREPFGISCRRLRVRALRSGTRRFDVYTRHRRPPLHVGLLGMLFHTAMAEAWMLFCRVIHWFPPVAFLWLTRRAAKRPRRIPREDSRVFVFFIGSLGLGGAQRQLLALAKSTQQRGHAAHIVIIKEQNDFYLNATHEAGLKLWDLSHYNKMPLWKRAIAKMLGLVLSDTEHIIRLAALLNEIQPDVIQSMLDQTNIIGVAAGRLACSPVVCGGLRSLSPVRKVAYSLDELYRGYRRTMRLADCFIANSEAGAADYSNWLGLERERIIVVRNGISDATFPPPTDDQLLAARRELSPDGTPVVLYVGRLSPEKRPDDFVQCCARLREEGVLFRAAIAGEGPVGAHIKRLIQNLGLEDTVLFLGARQDVAALLSVARVMVLTSSIEGCPNALMEAQLCRTPVVATDTGDNAFIVRDGETGYVVPIGNIKIMCERVRILLEDRGLAQEMGLAGRRRMEEVFSLSSMTEQTFHIYNRLMGREI